MMIRALTVSLLLAVMAAPAYAQDSTTPTAPQDNLQTRQTDQSEDDYRRSQRRRDAGSIFDDIDINTRGSGTGTILGREVKAIDRLDQESRRHLNKQRAKALAEANPGEPIDADFEPSEAGKADDYVAKQEEAAWEEMMRDANSGLNGMTGQGTGAGGGQSAGHGGNQSGQPGQGQSGQGQSSQGQSGQGEDGQSSQSGNSPLRGGSASSASSILDQLKGRSASGARNGSQQGQAPQGQPSSDVPSQGDAQTQAEAQAQAAAATAAQAAAEADAVRQSGADAAAQAQAEAQAEAAAKTAAEAKARAVTAAENQAAVDAAAQAQAESQDAADADAANAAAEAAAHRETMSPLERLKRDPVERDDVGGRTSAADYLNRGKKN